MVRATNKNTTRFPAQGRRIGGFSLRTSLENQGVTTEEEMRAHLTEVYEMTRINPKINTCRYRR